MKILILIVNYIFFIFGIMFVYYFFSEYNKNLFIMTALFFLSVIVNLIYVYKSIPYDKEKENLKEQINTLNKEIEDKDKMMEEKEKKVEKEEGENN